MLPNGNKRNCSLFCLPKCEFKHNISSKFCIMETEDCSTITKTRKWENRGKAGGSGGRRKGKWVSIKLYQTPEKMNQTRLKLQYRLKIQLLYVQLLQMPSNHLWEICGLLFVEIGLMACWYARPPWDILVRNCSCLAQCVTCYAVPLNMKCSL